MFTGGRDLLESTYAPDSRMSTGFSLHSPGGLKIAADEGNFVHRQEDCFGTGPQHGRFPSFDGDGNHLVF
jgi:hypothetical protein